jgi:hypothetical protein
MSAPPAPGYPVRVRGSLDPGLSRWLWLVKWLLVIPHYIVLLFLWAAFVVLSVMAGITILFTGRYPRALFDFNVGVLRWSWRVGFYAFGANGTDRYPPFTLGETDYPATLEIEYPEQLSRGLVLVKWWLLALPHYVVLGVLLGGAGWAAYHVAGGLAGVLVLFAMLALLFTGRYPRGIFDLLLGIDRWALRVAAYAGLMTDQYPPFRLDLGGDEPASLELPPAAPSAPWSGGRTAAAIGGGLLALLAAGLLAAGAVALVVDQTARDDQGFVMSGTQTYSTSTYALVSDTATIDVRGVDVLNDLVGQLKVRSDSSKPVFVGIGPAGAVSRYLRGVPRERVGDLAAGHGTVLAGTHRPAPPESQRFWVSSVSGTGRQTLGWDVRDGDWRIVVMAADATRGVRADVAVGAELPALLGVGLGLLAGGGLFLLASSVILVAAAGSDRKETES